MLGAQIQPEVDKDLDDAYKRFVNCSFCGLKNSDTVKRMPERLIERTPEVKDGWNGSVSDPNTIEHALLRRTARHSGIGSRMPFALPGEFTGGLSPFGLSGNSIVGRGFFRSWPLSGFASFDALLLLCCCRAICNNS